MVAGRVAWPSSLLHPLPRVLVLGGLASDWSCIFYRGIGLKLHLLSLVVAFFVDSSLLSCAGLCAWVAPWDGACTRGERVRRRQRRLGIPDDGIVAYRWPEGWCALWRLVGRGGRRRCASRVTSPSLPIWFHGHGPHRNRGGRCLLLLVLWRRVLSS